MGLTFNKVYQGRNCIRLCAELDECGASIKTSDEMLSFFRFKIRSVSPYPYLEFYDPDESGWSWGMIAGIYPRSNELFARTCSLIHHRLFYTGDGEIEITQAMREEASLVMKTIYADLRSIAVHVANVCSQPHRHAALRFLQPIRFRIYRELLNDKTGRLLQVSHSHPGVLIFAMALREHGKNSKQISHSLISDIISGKPLNFAIDKAIDGWLQTAKEIVQLYSPDSLRYENNPAWYRVLNASTTERERIRSQQRILVKGAGPQVAPTFLWLPPPIWFCPEDIPRKVRANARWFQVMKQSSCFLSYGSADEMAYRLGLASVVSKNVDALYGPRFRSPDIAELLDYLEAVKIVPNRKSNLERIIDESAEWHVRFGRKTTSTSDVALPQILIASKTHDLEIVPISSSAELDIEGRQMRHCVFSRLPQAKKGKRFYVSARFGKRRLTVEVRKRDIVTGNSSQQLTISEIKGRSNSLPHDKEIAALQEWIESENYRLELESTGSASTPFERKIHEQKELVSRFLRRC